MILIKYLHIGIDDTDSPEGMCTTYLVCHIINELKEVGIEIVGFPRLIRLNPFARFKTCVRNFGEKRICKMYSAKHYESIYATKKY